MAHVKPLLDSNILPMAILNAGKGEWFVSATYPASLGIMGGGLYHAEFGASVEECVEKIMAWYDEQWSGL